MNRLSFSHPLIRAAFCVFLLALPLASAWNLTIAPTHPALAIKIGPKLGGVTRDAPVILSWASLRDGSFQKAAASRVTDAMAIRPMLIRINNEIRFEVFGELTVP
jgi:alginate O-acetyltransferase complex protein AlgJ